MKILTFAATAAMFLHSVSATIQPIVETDSFDTVKNILSSADKDTIVGFACDKVLFLETDSCFTSGKVDAFINDITEISPKFADKLTRIVWESKKQSVVAPRMPELISELQERGVKTLAVAEKCNESYDRRTFSKFILDDLSFLEYNFSKGWENVPLVQLGDASDFCSFENGVICSGFYKSGDALKKFFNHNNLTPSKIMFVDFNKKNLDNVIEAFGNSNVSLTCIRYTATEAEEIIPTSETRTDYKFGCLVTRNRWLSDTNADLNIMEFADELFSKLPVEEKSKKLTKILLEDKALRNSVEKLLADADKVSA